MVMRTGHIPVGFNTSLLIPIPKKNEVSNPTDYRPISISTSIATLFETLLFVKLPQINTEV